MADAKQRVELPNGLVAVLNASASGRFGNLTAIDRENGEIWRAALPEGGVDSFVHAELDGGLLKANSFSGWCVWLDPDTGKAVRSVFTK